MRQPDARSTVHSHPRQNRRLVRGAPAHDGGWKRPTRDTIPGCARRGCRIRCRYHWPQATRRDNNQWSATCAKVSAVDAGVARSRARLSLEAKVFIHEILQAMKFSKLVGRISGDGADA